MDKSVVMYFHQKHTSVMSDNYLKLYQMVAIF